MAIRVDVSERYKQCSDVELQRLAEGINDLVSEAQQALITEMRARGIQHGVQTAHEVKARAEAEAIAAVRGPDYFIVTEAGQHMPGWFQVITPRQDLRFPDICPVCGKAADTVYPVVSAQLSKATMSTRMRIEHLEYQVPHCQACRRENITGKLPLMMMVFGALAALALTVGLWLGPSAAMAAVLLAFILGFDKIRALARQAPGGIFMLDDNEDSIWFVMKDRGYAEKFSALNSGRASAAQIVS